MDLISVTLLVIVCYAVYRFGKKKQQFFEAYGIPYHPGKLFLGNVSLPSFNKKHLNDQFLDIYNINRDAKYIGIFEFTTPQLVIRDLDLIKSITIKNFDSFINHRSFVDANVDPLFAGNLLSMKDDRWKEARALLSPAFTGSKMKGMHELMISCARNVMDYLDELSEKDKRMLNTKEIFGRYTTDTIATCGFGISVNSLKNPDNDFFVLGKELAKFSTLKMIKFFASLALPFISKIADVRFFDERIANFFTNIVKTTVETRDKEGISRPDMIQLMMNARGRENSNLKLDYVEMTAQALIFFFGGFESTSTHMCLMAHELTVNPDIQKKLQEEIDEVMSRSSGEPTYEDIQSMLYLDAIFQETLRLHPINGMLDRVCVKTFELPPTLPGRKPFIVKPGMVLFFPVIGIHRDSKYYEDPEKFDPERYYGKKININDTMSLGFGIGPRSCIGNRFAILESKILLTLLLHKYDLIPTEKTCKPIVYDPSTFNLQPKNGFWVTLKSRKS